MHLPINECHIETFVFHGRYGHKVLLQMRYIEYILQVEDLTLRQVEGHSPCPFQGICDIISKDNFKIGILLNHVKECFLEPSDVS